MANERSSVGQVRPGRLAGPIFALIALASACASGELPDATPEANEAVELSGATQSLSVPPVEYFQLTRDLRRCASPLCGGFWLTAVNRLATRCSDGSYKSRCYVAEADFGAAGGEPVIEGNGVVVRGQIQSSVYPDFGELGRFVAASAWEPGSAAAAAGAFFRVGDNGIRCITTPCFSTDADILNLGVKFSLSDLDLSRVGASEADLEAANAALAQNDLIVAGSLSLRRQGGSVGIALTASQFYVPAATRCYSDDDCQTGERCNAGEICLPPGGCSDGRVCPAVCTGFCVDAPVSECKSDADCAEGNWCRVTEAGSYSCVPFATEGERCNGFTLPWMYEQCSPELTCDLPNFVADAPGTCRASCKSDADCAESAYCATDGLCHEDASCDVAADCLAEGNTYTRILCLGYPTCPQFGIESSCGWSCGDARCIDHAGHDFGPCDAVLGWGREFDRCVELSGCSSGEHELFASEAECLAACGG